MTLNHQLGIFGYLAHPELTAEDPHHSAEHHYVFQTMGKSNRPYTGRDWDLSK